MHRNKFVDSWKRFQLPVLIFALTLLLSLFEVAVSQDGSYPHNDNLFAQIEMAQNNENRLDNSRLTIQLNDATIQQSLELLANKANVGFSYNPNVIPLKRITLMMSDVPAYEVLYKILEDTRLEPVLPPSKDVIVIREKDIQVGELNLNQVVTITGTVTDGQSSEPIPGVNVTIKGAPSMGAATDLNGNYSLNVRSLERDTLRFSYIGYQILEEPINGRTTVDVSLALATVRGQEIVVSGYQTQQRVDVTGSISSVDIDAAFGGRTVNNPIQALQGQAAGLYVTTSGDPSGADTQVRVRGGSTLNDNDPLYVIDGVPTKQSAFSVLNPNDIADIQILKDAPSSAIYGSRASNGVILITTKKAVGNTFSVNYSSNLSFSRINNRPELLNPTERAEVEFWANVYVGNNPDDIPVVDYDWERTGPGRFDYQINSVILPDELAPGVPANKEGTDWFDVATRPGVIQEHSLSIAAGGERGGALFSGRIHDNQYIYKNRDFSKYQVRVNSHFDVIEGGGFTIGQNLSISTSKDRGLKSDLQDALSGRSLRPILPVYEDDGDFSGPPTGDFTDSENPLGLLTLDKDDVTRSTTVFGNVYANINLLQNLSWNSNFGIDWTDGINRNIARRYQWGFLSRNINYLENIDNNEFNWNLNSVLNYQLDLDDHSVTLLGGIEATENEEVWNLSRRDDFSLETVDFFVEGAASGNQSVNGARTGFSLLSFFTKADYAYQNRYLFSVTVRHDGSSKFAKENRFGTFPSFTVGWRINEESFMDDVSFLSELKLRAGWGRTGNQGISNEARFDLYDVSYQGNPVIMPWNSGFSYANYGTAYSYSGADTGTLPSGFRKVQTGNPNLQWETTEEYNVGVDYSIHNDKIFGSLDYFMRNTFDILIEPDIISAVGEGGARFLNGASVEVKGFEVSTTFRDRIGDINYRITGNLGFFDDKITKLPADVVDSFTGNTEQTILGRSPNALFGYVADGLFRSQAEIDAHAVQPGKDLGRIRYKDLNGDGVINTLDQKYFGSATANIEYGVNLGLNYKNIDFNAFLQGVAKRDVMDHPRDNYEFVSSGSGTNYGKRILNAWTPTNSGSSIPAVTVNDDNNEFRTSTYFLANGSYAKLRSVTLGYTLSNFSFAKSLRLYVTWENLFTIKAPSFISEDPERPTYTFPRPQTLNFGVDIQF
jgi:TonB-linked SusC/RagA family outer membrane protein